MTYERRKDAMIMAVKGHFVLQVDAVKKIMGSLVEKRLFGGGVRRLRICFCMSLDLDGCM